MDLVRCKEGLRQWFAAQSGIAVDQVQWAGEPRPFGAPLEAEIAFVGAIANVGGDELRRGPTQQDATKLAHTVLGTRQLTVQCTVWARAGEPGWQALAYCDRVRDRLPLPSSEALLEAAGVALHSVLRCEDVHARLRGGRVEPSAVLELRFNAASVLVDATEPTADTLAHAGLAVEAVAGEAVTVPETMIPEIPTP